MLDRISEASIAAVLFDLDGTLIDSAAATTAAIIETLAAFGRPVSLDEVAEAIGAGRPLRRWFAEGLELTTGDAEAAYRQYVHTISARAALTQPLPGADSLLRSLDRQGIAMAVATTRLVEIAVPLINSAGWLNYFGIIVGQETAERPKPAPQPALHALRALGVAADQSVMVGDTESDMLCGAAARLSMVLGVTGVRSAAQLRAAGATDVCESLAEVETLLLRRVAQR